MDAFLKALQRWTKGGQDMIKLLLSKDR